MLTGVQAKFVINDAVGKPQLYALLASLSHHLTPALDLPDTEALNKVMREVSDQWDRDDMNTKLLAIISKRTHDHPHLYALFTPVTDFMTSFKLNASMKVDGLGKPTLTNAEWSKASSTLTWASDRNPWAPGLATPGLYWTAAWITPDDQAQQHAFGDHFRLGDNDLLAFAVAWNAASDAGQQLLQNRIDDGDFMADANGNAPKAGPLESIALNMIDSLGTPGG